MLVLLRLPRRAPISPALLCSVLSSFSTQAASNTTTSTTTSPKIPFRREWYHEPKNENKSDSPNAADTHAPSARDLNANKQSYTTQGTTTEPGSVKETEILIQQIKQDIDRDHPITLSRLELLLTHPLLSAPQIFQICDIAQSAGINSCTLYYLALETLSRPPHWNRSQIYIDKVMGLMESSGITPSTRSYLSNMRAYSKAGKIDRAQALLQEMDKDGVSTTTVAFNTLLTSRSKRGHLDQCVELYQTMIERGVIPNTHTLVILMEGFCAFGGLHYAIKMFEKFKEDGYTASTDLCNVLMKQIVELGTIAQLEFLFNQMRQDYTIRPNLETYSYMIEAYKKANLPHKAEEMEYIMKEDEFLPDLTEIGSRLVNLGKTGYFAQVEKTIKTLKRMGAPLNVDCYNALINSYCNNVAFANRGQGLAAYDRMIQAGLEPNMDSFIGVMTIHSKNRDWSNVKTTYNNIREYVNKKKEEGESVNVPASMHNIAMSAFLETGDYAQARDLLTTLESSSSSIDISLYDMFISSLGYAGVEGKEERDVVGEVAKMVSHLQERGVEPSTMAYKELLDNLINQQQTDTAVKLLEFLCTTRKKNLNVNMFESTIRAYCSENEHEKAVEVVGMMKREEMKPTEQIITALVFCLVRARKFETAWDMVTWGKEVGMDVIGFGDIIQAATKKASMLK